MLGQTQAGSGPGPMCWAQWSTNLNWVTLRFSMVGGSGGPSDEILQTNTHNRGTIMSYVLWHVLCPMSCGMSYVICPSARLFSIWPIYLPPPPGGSWKREGEGGTICSNMVRLAGLCSNWNLLEIIGSCSIVGIYLMLFDFAGI